MTTKDSILALAAKISNGTVPNVTTDAQALAELAKAMCGSAPTEPIATVDDAIAYITANYSGGGGGGAQISDVYLWNMTGNVVPSKVEYISGYSGENPTYTELETEGITNEFNGNTVYGIKVKDCPAGGFLNYTLPSGYIFGSGGGAPRIGYSAVLFPAMPGVSTCAMVPIEGMYQCAPFVVVTAD